MRRRGIHSIILAACIVLIVGSPRASAWMDQGTGMTTALVNFNAAGSQLVRFDTQGNAVDAHEGQIALFASTYYFYGTGYGCGFREYHPTTFCGFNVYSSTDLTHWANQGTLFDATTDYWQTLCGHGEGCFRPHVIYNASTQRYVLWFSAAQATNGYVVMDSASPTGPFVLRPAPQLAIGDSSSSTQSYQGDESLFVDDDNTAYLIHTDWRRQGDMVIEQLDPSYESTTGRYVRLQVTHNEAPTMFKRNGLYYVMTSDPNCAYCQGTGTGYLTASSPLGPWSGDGPTPPPYWQMSNGTLLANGGGPGFSISGGDWTDYTFSFDTQPLTTTNGRYAQSGWFLRAENESEPNSSQMGGYVWSLTNNPSLGISGGALVETIVQNGQAVSRTFSLPFPVTGNTWYHVAASVAGNVMTTTVNGQVVDVTSDATYAQGRVGFVENTADGESARFKNVYVTAADGAPLIDNDFSQFDPPLPPRQTIKISSDSCGGQPADVVALPSENGPFYLYLSDLWNSGDMPGLSNYYMGLLSFNGNGSIVPLTCQPSVPLTLAIGSPQQQDTPPDVDQSSGYDGFQLQCDIGGATMRLQTFVPSRSGTLTTVYVTTYQLYFGTSAPLEIDIVPLDSEGHPGPTLYRGTVAPSDVRNAADVVTVAPGLGVTAGQPYGILVRSATGVGCYGSAYSDANPYPSGREYLSTDGGATWQLEPGRALKFAIAVSQTAPTATATVAPVETPTPTPPVTVLPTAPPLPTATPPTMLLSTPAGMPSQLANGPTTTPLAPPANTPTSTATALRQEPATVTATALGNTPTARPASKQAAIKTKGFTRRISLPLAVHVTPATIRFASRLVIVVYTVRRAHINIALQVRATRIRVIGHGKQRKRSAYSVIVFSVKRSGNANAAGRYATTVRVSYRPTRLTSARVTVTARFGHKAAIWSRQVRMLPTLQGPRGYHRTPRSGQHAKRGHPLPKRPHLKQVSHSRH